MSEHTPGELEMRVAANGDVGIVAPGYAGVIAEFFAELKRQGDQRPDEAKANARLFIAAPNLLAACEALLDGIESGSVTIDDEDRESALRAAIAKARGGGR